ncbi:MAG: type II toxin-antitoxin system Y4mF family antitoxin [Armatimonadetes bacterium]|nr:type II toxin-antitoxin system Y4mF family antitoxin [Armatimonadota bacterium]
MQINTPSDLGGIIRARRRRLGLDQRTLAERAGVSRQWIVEVEKGKPRAEIGLLLQSLNALGLHLRAESAEAASAPPADGVDIDAVIDRARGKPS